jgi:DNA-directed RNA polymerase subunit M/transcription elongation factor TFIIS
MSIRTEIKAALGTVVKNEKNVDILEKSIYENTGNSEDAYRDLTFQVICDITGGKKLTEVLEYIKNGGFGWNHVNFQDTKFKQNEQDEFIMNPFEVEEGVLVCPKCKNSRTFSYTKQVRSCDEGTSVFASCMTCKHKWTHSG